MLNAASYVVQARTEFGAKIGASIVEDYTFIDHHSWDAYNESQDLLLQIQLFKERFGYLPATILADKIYLNRANRDILEDFEIQDTARCWTGMCYFVKNVMKFLRELYLVLTEIEVFNQLSHYEESHLLPSVCDRKLIQQTLIRLPCSPFRCPSTRLCFRTVRFIPFILSSVSMMIIVLRVYLYRPKEN